MNFAIFFASFMLIVQQLTTGLPITESQVKNSCSEGLIMVNDQCVPLKTEANNNEIESSTNNVIRQEKSIDDCPKGMEYDKNGVCQKLKYSKNIEVATESTTIFDDNSTVEEKLSQCPEGTKRDEQGSCQEIEPSDSTKKLTDPKMLLKKDGSCPDNYKMIEGRCLYIKPKRNATSLITNDFIPDTIQSRSGHDVTEQYELVPVLPDNSCPQGTEYIDYSLCRKRVHPTTSNNLTKTVENCPENFILVSGKCISKTLKKQDQHQYKENSTMTSQIKSENKTEIQNETVDN